MNCGVIGVVRSCVVFDWCFGYGGSLFLVFVGCVYECGLNLRCVAGDVLKLLTSRMKFSL